MNKSQLIYQVYVGKKSALYDHCTASVRAYAEAMGVDYVCQTVPKLFIKPDPFTTGRSWQAVERLGYLPIFEKENAFDYFEKGYDQIAIIDSDVYVRPDSPNIFDDLPPEYDFGAVVERDMPITDVYKKKIINYSYMQYKSITNVDFKPNDLGYEFMNMGIMVMNKSITKYLNGQTAKQFIQRPEFKNFVDGVGPWKWSTDQTLLNTWIRHSGMKYKGLHWKWNGLYSVNKKIHVCHFIHFFLKDKLPNRGENVTQLMKDIL